MPLARRLGRVLRHPSTSVPAILLVALAVGVSTALFAYFSALLWPHVEAPEAEELVQVHVGTDADPRGAASYAELELLRRDGGGLTRLVAYSPFGASLGDGSRTRFTWAYAVSAGYFELFGKEPLAGRLLQPGDDRRGAPAVAVLHPAFWRARLGADAGVVGRSLRLNGVEVTVVGVAPEGFQGHGHAMGVYVPLAAADALTGVARTADPGARWLQLLGRLEDGWTPERARAALAPAGRAADALHPLEGTARRIDVVRADRHDEAWGPDPQLESARMLFGVALLFLVLAAASVTNLLLARTAAQRRELGVRAALGESRRRTTARILGSGLTLCLTGGLLGLPLALLLAAHLDSLVLGAGNPAGLGGWSEWSRLVRLDARGYAFALAAAGGCALVAGIASLPSALGRGRQMPALLARGAAADAAGLRGRRALVAVQMALSLVLCLAGGLLARTLREASRIDPGFAVRDLHLATLYVPRTLGDAAAGTLLERLRAEAERIPGARRAGLAHQPPLAGWWRPAEVARAERPDELLAASYDLVSAGTFATLGLPLLAGRSIEVRDGAQSPPVVVLGADLARRLWGSAAGAVGRRLIAPGSPHEAWEVVGVVADALAGSPGDPSPSAVYFPVAQRPHGRMTLLLRSPLPAEQVAAQVRAALHRVDPGLSVVETSTGEEARLKALLPQRMHAEVASSFALLGLVVAMVGLFGLLNHLVSSGRRELAVRLAVGAAPRDVLGLVARDALRILATGGLLGIALWVPGARLLRGLLFGVEPLDLATLAAGAALLLLAAGAAVSWPALRAARTDPAASLRQG